MAVWFSNWVERASLRDRVELYRGKMDQFLDQFVCNGLYIREPSLFESRGLDLDLTHVFSRFQCLIFMRALLIFELLRLPSKLRIPCQTSLPTKINQYRQELMSNDASSDARSIPTPYCHNMSEHPSAATERLRLYSDPSHRGSKNTDLSVHIMHGLAYTVGSALGCAPPSVETCLEAFVAENKAGLTAGSRGWSKHAHRSRGDATDRHGLETAINPSEGNAGEREIRATRQRDADALAESVGWWSVPSGPVARINEQSLLLFWKVMNNASWRNLHWLPHGVLAYEVRVPEGYGMRWSQDRAQEDERGGSPREEKPWVFRGFLEPQMDNGHEVGWRH